MGIEPIKGRKLNIPYAYLPSVSNSTEIMSKNGYILSSAIYDEYLNDKRHYHDIRHIVSIINKIQEVSKQYNLSEDDTVILHLIAWYHDIIYKVGSLSNEVDSANLFGEHFASKKDSKFDKVIDGILSTKSHSDCNFFTSSIFCDLDLHELGTDKYSANAEYIKKEALYVMDANEFHYKRQLFLKSMLNKQFIFHTSWGWKYELPARVNIINGLSEAYEEE